MQHCPLKTLLRDASPPAPDPAATSVRVPTTSSQGQTSFFQP